jgi:hypothetical protein
MQCIFMLYTNPKYQDRPTPALPVQLSLRVTRLRRHIVHVVRLILILYKRLATRSHGD